MRLDYSLNEHRNDHKVFILKILYQSPDADTFRQSAIITAQNLLLHKVPLYQSYFIFFCIFNEVNALHWSSKPNRRPAFQTYESVFSLASTPCKIDIIIVIYKLTAWDIVFLPRSWPCASSSAWKLCCWTLFDRVMWHVEHECTANGGGRRRHVRDFLLRLKDFIIYWSWSLWCGLVWLGLASYLFICNKQKLVWWEIYTS